MKSYKNIMILMMLTMLLSACGAYMNQPMGTQPARIGEATEVSKRLIALPEPSAPAVVGVYEFEDQTGQFKQSENGSTFSNAVTQGGTTILVKALEDSKWFTPIERENLGNLLQERNIILNTRKDYAARSNTQVKELDPLLYAGVLIEGGIVSYDTNVLTGGAGARYFGAGGSTKYRQDRVTVYLRAVSTKTGKIMKTVYVSKTIYSQAVDASLFRYVSFKRLLEAETGFTRNEPGQLAVKEAIEKAVEALIIEGIDAQLWYPKGGKPVADQMVAAYKEEKSVAENTDVYQRNMVNRRSKWRVDVGAGGTLINGDYPNAYYEYALTLGAQYNFSPYVGIHGSVHKFRLKNTDLFNREFAASELNVHLTMLPYDKFTPYVYGGGGLNHANWFEQNDLKVQAGLGLEYTLSPSIGVKLYADYNAVLSDDLDYIVAGQRDDHYLKFGLGVNIYLGGNEAKDNDEKRKMRKYRRPQRRIEKMKLRVQAEQEVAGDTLSRKRNNSNFPNP
ncbi:CsgG/HfaB family protein [Nonlabens ulvanivorans]|uniref:CsgG/HfaB family protein n=1 Tax=Nonlabens ulvanivorans TaxID=906888 RepID=UPI00329770DF